MRVEKKESYRGRAERVEADLIEFGVSSGLPRKLTYSYRLGLSERLIKASGKFRPEEPATYFLKGLERSRVKRDLQRGPIGDEDMD